jgi:hypothetical protein
MTTTFTFNIHPFTSTATTTILQTSNFGFRRKKQLLSVTLEPNVTTIASSCFLDCNLLNTVDFSNANYLSSSCASAFKNCDALTSVDLSSCASLDSISTEMFMNCFSLTSVFLPSSLTSISARAFNGCSALTNISMPFCVTDIGYGAFNGCSSLGLITYKNPKIITTVGATPFLNINANPTINFYQTLPIFPYPNTNVYNTTLYPSNTTFNYYTDDITCL